MKRFESLYNEWIDGTLDPEREKELMTQLENAPKAEQEKVSYQKLRDELRAAATETKLEHPDFINAQVLEEIRRDQKRKRPPRRMGGFALAGGFLTAFAIVLTAILLPQVQDPIPHDQLVTRVIEQKTGSPEVFASTFRAPDGHGVVIWLEGIDYIPAEQEIR